MDPATYLADNYLCAGISFDGLMRFQREFTKPEIMSQVTGKELYHMILDHTKPPEDRPFIKVPFYASGQPFFSSSELGPGNVFLSYQWDAPFSQVFEAVSSLQNRNSAFFLIDMLCCPSHDASNLKCSKLTTLLFVSEKLKTSPITWLGVLRWSSDLLNADWILNRRWILTEMLMCLRSGAAPEFYCCLDGVFKPKRNAPPSRISPLLQLLKCDCQSVLKQFSSIDYEKSVVHHASDLELLLQSLRLIYACDTKSDSEFSGELTQVAISA